MLRTHRMKSDEKPFFCQLNVFFFFFLGKMVHVVIDGYFCLFLKGLKIFLSLRLSLIVPLRGVHISCRSVKWAIIIFLLEACELSPGEVPPETILYIHYPGYYNCQHKSVFNYLELSYSLKTKNNNENKNVNISKWVIKVN